MAFDTLEVPGWVGFLLLIVIGLLMAIHGCANPLGVTLTHENEAGFQTFGLLAIAVGTFSWIAGGASKVAGKVGKVGVRVRVTDLPWWAWVADIALVIVAIIVYFGRT